MKSVHAKTQCARTVVVVALIARNARFGAVGVLADNINFPSSDSHNGIVEALDDVIGQRNGSNCAPEDLECNNFIISLFHVEAWREKKTDRQHDRKTTDTPPHPALDHARKHRETQCIALRTKQTSEICSESATQTLHQPETQRHKQHANSIT